mgnify:FL=1
MEQSLKDGLAEYVELQKQAEEKKAELYRKAVEEIQRLVDAFEVPASAIKFKKAVKPAIKSAKTTPPPKYRDPDSGKTWSGRGQMPGWFKAALDAGFTKEDLLIEA